MSAANKGPAQRVAYSGILAACCLLTLFLATVLPTNRIFFYGLSSVFAAIIIIEHGTKAGGIFYVATCLLALMIIPNKLRLIPYIFILGHYPIWKTCFERQKNRAVEILLKLLVLDLGTLAAYYVFTGLFFHNLTLPVDVKLILLGLQVLFIVYDYVFTLFIKFYLDKIRPMTNR